MQNCAYCARERQSFRELAQYQRYKIKNNEPPSAFAAIMQPLGTDREAEIKADNGSNRVYRLRYRAHQGRR
jgi:hypothetical protein